MTCAAQLRSLRLRFLSDDGGAIVEFTFLGVLLLVPLTYALITAFQVQSAAYALTAASRDAGFAAVRADSWSSANERAHLASEVALGGAGLDASDAEIRLTCSQEPCLTPGGQVIVRMSTRVPLPWIPPFIDAAPSVAVSTEHRAAVDQFRQGRA